MRYTDPTGHCPICITAGIGGGVGAALYLWNESQQSDGVDLSVSLTWNGWLPTGIEMGDDWGDLAVATGTGAVAGALMPAGGVWSVAGGGMASNVVAEHMTNLMTGKDFSAPYHAYSSMVAASGAVATAGVGTITSTFVKTGSQFLDDAIGIGARGITGGVHDTLADLNQPYKRKQMQDFGSNIAWNIVGETFGQTLGVLGGEWVNGAWGMTTHQGYAFWGAWGTVVWEYFETAGRVMFQQREEDK